MLLFKRVWSLSRTAKWLIAMLLDLGAFAAPRAHGRSECQIAEIYRVVDEWLMRKRGCHGTARFSGATLICADPEGLRSGTAPRHVSPDRRP